MPDCISLKPNVDLGVVPTHLKFVGGLVPDEAGKLPRDADGKLVVVANMAKLCSESLVRISCVQVPFFPGLDEADVKEMVDGFRELKLQVHFIMMVGGADPMNPEDEDAVVEILVGGLSAAKKHGIETVSSTSVEEWLKPGATRKEGDEFTAAVAQNVRVHSRAFKEAELDGSPVKAWHIEFLRGGEFKTFTDIGRIWTFVEAVNKEIGKSFFKVMVDAAHCGDSTLSIPENEAIIQKIADGDGLGIFHASAKTTRGCLSTDDGWIGALLTACARTGKLKTAFVEVFHHEDAALEGLRNLDPGHGLDTCDGRTYDQVVLDGLTDVARRLNNLSVRGIL
ncbi:hypothetical protein [Rosistilla oblonga]|uniref:hypothetical protein n=1 Tax=Rosistilla oblonga TaxID=2527990 RepID=UPI003A98199C